MPLDFVQSACPHDCPSTCALEVERLDANRIGKVRGAAENSYTQGVICAKVSRYAERVHHPDRLDRPLRRIGDKDVGRDAFEPIGWDDALDLVAEGLTNATQTFGSESVWPYFYAGTMGLVQRDGIERFRHALRYSRQLSTICTALSDAGWIVGTGLKRGIDSRELAESDLIVVWGGNPVATQVNVMHHVSRARKERGAKLVVIDPYRTGTAAVADMHLCLRPGTDAALACAVMHICLKEGYADRAYMEKYTDGWEELSQHLATRTPEWAADITGLSVEEIIAFARLYGTTKRSFVRIGYGFSRSRNGAMNVFAASCLPGVTGAWQYRGGGALYSNSGMYGLDATLIQGLDVQDKSTRLLDQSRIGPVLNGDPSDIGDGPPVAALFVQNTNPMVVCPDTRSVHAGMSRDDLFICVHEQFMTETAAMADIVLPATMFLEHDDMYIAGGHSHIQVTKKVIEPHGECRSNHDVICGLAERLGADHPGFGMTAWEIIDHTLKSSGLHDAETAYEMRWIDCMPEFEDAHYLTGFAWEDEKFHFKPDWSRVGKAFEGLPARPDHLDIIDRADEEHPFRLVAAPARQFLNSSFTETPGSRKREGRPTVKVHPKDAAQLGIAEGGRVRLGNKQGSVVVHAELFDGVQTGVVVVESIWPNADFEEGWGINTLVSAEPGKPRGGAVFHDTAVWVRTA